MRVNLLITELRTGGAERCLTELAIGLQERGDSVRIMTLMPLPVGLRGELVERLREEKIEISSCDVDSPWQLLQAVKRVRQWICDDPPDVLQTFLFHANAVGALAARKTPSVACVLGVRVAQPSFTRTWLERKLAARATGVVCVSKSVQSFVEGTWRLPKTVHLTSIPNGIRVPASDSVTAVDWTDFGLAPGGVVLLFLGRLHMQKGLDLLIEVAPQLVQLHDSLRIVVIGEGPMKPQIDRLREELPQGRMVTLPWQSDVWPIYYGSDIVVLPSRYEGMPNVILEAMAAGRCVLASDVEGVGELLGPQHALQTFPAENLEAFRSSLRELLRYDAREELGALNRVRIAKEFSIATMVESYRNVYHDWADSIR